MEKFANVFSQSSIHGLPYLTSKKQGTLGRLAWLVCVLVSFSLAGLVIWSNVDNWRSQPAVVTSVEYSLIEEKPWMPQVIACPSTLNGAAMLTGLLHHTHQKLLNPELLSKLKVVLLQMWIMEDYFLRRRKIRIPQKRELQEMMNKAKWKDCFEVKTVTESCNWVLVLMDLLKKFGFTIAHKHIVGYVAATRAKNNTKGIIEYMNRVYNVNQTELFNMGLDSLYYNRDKILRLYTTFFHLVDKDGTTLLGPHSLNAYVASMPDIKLQTGSKFGHFLTWFLNGYSQWSHLNRNMYNPVQDFYRIVSTIWLDSLKIYLNVDSHDQAIMLINAFWHGGHETDLFQPFTQMWEGNSCIQAAQNITLNNICNDEIIYLSECTREYCKLIRNARFEVRSRVKEVLNMGLAEPSTFSTFYACQLPGKDMTFGQHCWKRVINDKGTSGKSISRQMQKYPLRFFLDGHKHVGITETDFNTYNLVTNTKPDEQPSPLIRKIHVHVVPYGQHAVEDRLGEMESGLESIFLDRNPQYKSNEFARKSENTIASVWTRIDHVLNSTEAFKSMDPAHKKCYLPKEEKKLRHFDEYSEADCTLECAWELARKHCQCVPWYMIDMYPTDAMCEIFGNRCFDQVVNTRYIKGSLAQEKCEDSCLLNCDRIHYEIRRDTEESKFNDDQAAFYQKYSAMKASKIPLEVQEFAGNKLDRFVKTSNVAIIELHLSNSKLAQEIVRTATMTTTDLISNIGGTLGLFCGMSALSLAEIMYWTGRAVWGIFTKKMHK